MDYNEALKYIDTELKGGCNPGLGRIIRLLKLTGNPQNGLKIIHIAGTNGKGSTAAMISEILREAGYKVGTYISPHLTNITERYLINNIEIEKCRFSYYVDILKGKIEHIKETGEEIPSQFEMLTALAFLYLKDENVDIAVIEVGLGGRYDATNVLNALVTVIMSISFDHMSILGNTIEEIAYEKAGIIKSKGITILYPQKYSEAEKVIESISIKMDNRLIKVKKGDVLLKSFGMNGQIMDYSYKGIDYKEINLPLLGEHQLLNAAVAITVTAILGDLGYKIDKENIKNGIGNVKWLGRLSIISKNPLILIDGAHNIDGITMLASAIKSYFPGKKLILVMGMLKDKEHDKSLEVIAPLANTFIATEPRDARALSAKDLGEEANKYNHDVKVEPSLEKAIKVALSLYSEDSVICIAGSLYLIGEANNLLNKGVNNLIID